MNKITQHLNNHLAINSYRVTCHAGLEEFYYAPY